VFIDEIYMGPAHARSDTLPADPHLVRLEREGFRSVDTTLTVGAAQVLRVEFRLKKPQPRRSSRGVTPRCAGALLVPA